MHLGCAGTASAPRSAPILGLAHTLVVVTLLVAGHAAAEEPIVDRPIRFDAERIELTRRYIHQHYGLRVAGIEIVPKAIVVHWTATGSAGSAFRTFDRTRIHSARRHLLRGGPLNVSAHFLVDRRGRIFRLMPERWMARHCIGLNYDALGIENVGDGKQWPLTRAQLAANVWLIRYLTKRYPIRYLLGHFEWRRFQRAPFYRERDPTYRNAKADPGPRFMAKLRARLSDLRLAGTYPPRR